MSWQGLKSNKITLSKKRGTYWLSRLSPASTESTCLCNFPFSMFWNNRVYTERNKWYILTHLGESGYCLETSTNCWVNWPDCCKFSGQWPRSVKSAEMKITIYPSACRLLNLLYYTIEKCRFVSPLWHCVFMEICLIFYSYYIVRTWYIYYTMLAMYVLV